MASNKEFLEERFKKELELLNPGQSKAVTTIEGPVLVIAGPGTGKTQILAARIGKILQETDTPPHNILCLTFTDTGRVEMRNRLFKFIGPAAYRIPVHTFHSFCNEVIQDNLSYFGKLNLEAVSELEEIELLRKLADTIEPDSPLKRFKGDVYYEVPRLKSLFSIMKKEAWSPEYLTGKIDDYLEDLPMKEGFFYKRAYKGAKPGDPNPTKITAEKERMEMLRAAATLYTRYTQMMREAGRYTFDDMILWVLDAFEKNKNILLDYQERYLYFLVDEFQDTSGSQNKLLQSLVAYWNPPNVFVVGDDDQSVFSFQDANVENIRKFAKTFEKDICKVVLTENYRSTQAILDIAKTLIENNKERIVNDDPETNKNLISAKKEIQHITAKPEIIEYPNIAQEVIGVADNISQLIKDGVAPPQIAVIYRNHKQVEELTTYLEKQKIAVNIKRGLNLLELPFVKNILHILEYLAAENDMPYSGDELLFEILHYDFFDIRPIDIAKTSVAVAQKNYGDRKEKYSIRRAISEQVTTTAPGLFDDPRGTNEIKQVSNALESLIKKVNNATLQELFEELIREAGILKYIMRSPEKAWLMQVLSSLFDFIKAESKKDPEITLPQLLKTVQLMQENGLRMEIQKISASGTGVNLVTAHGSKGAQYGHVFLIGCNENIWDAKNSGGNRNYKFPDNLFSTATVAGDLEESRRLFYVAMTRAETHLCISYPAKDNNGKDLVRSTFVSEISGGAGMTIEKRQVDESVLTAYLALQFTAGASPEIELPDKIYIDQLLQRYSLSVTHLSNYLECPIKFYYQNLIKVPSAKSESMTFGSAVHFALQRLFEKMKARENVFPDKADLLNDFSWYMHRNRESFTKDQFKRRMEYGQKILPAYHDFYIDKWNKFVIVEKNIRNIELKGVPLNGKLDKLEFEGKNINVVDYKTGKYENGKNKLKPPSDEDPNGGNYWRQAVFYKILLDNDRSNDWKAVSAEFDFVEPVKQEYKTEKLIISQSDIEIVTGQITATWTKIQHHEFSKGCGKKDCHWCNFVKDNKMHIALHEAMEEED